MNGKSRLNVTCSCEEAFPTGAFVASRSQVEILGKCPIRAIVPSTNMLCKDLDKIDKSYGQLLSGHVSKVNIYNGDNLKSKNTSAIGRIICSMN